MTSKRGGPTLTLLNRRGDKTVLCRFSNQFIAWPRSISPLGEAWLDLQADVGDKATALRDAQNCTSRIPMTRITRPRWHECW